MNRKFVKNNCAFNIRLNEEEYEMVRKLKDIYAINISKAFKNYLKDLLSKMENK
jgi:hypothetical protein